MTRLSSQGAVAVCVRQVGGLQLLVAELLEYLFSAQLHCGEFAEVQHWAGTFSLPIVVRPVRFLTIMPPETPRPNVLLAQTVNA